jgi:hypothetical protein
VFVGSCRVAALEGVSDSGTKLKKWSLWSVMSGGGGGGIGYK